MNSAAGLYGAPHHAGVTHRGGNVTLAIAIRGCMPTGAQLSEMESDRDIDDSHPKSSIEYEDGSVQYQFG